MSDYALFAGSIPEHYDRGLGPHIFEDYAADLAERAGALRPSAVLELAAGTGIASRMLRDAIPPDATLTVSDLNEPMLDVARTKFEPGEDVRFRLLDAMELDVADQSFDLVVCQFGIMFFPDKRASLVEALRALKPGGTYLLSVWGDLASNPFADVAHQTGAKFFPSDPPLFYTVPFSYFDIRQVEDDLRSAGFGDISHQVLETTKSLVDVELFANGLVRGNPMIDELRDRAGVTPENFQAELALALEDRFGPAPTTMPLKAIVFSARRD